MANDTLTHHFPLDQGNCVIDATLAQFRVTLAIICEISGLGAMRVVCYDAMFEVQHGLVTWCDGE